MKRPDAEEPETCAICHEELEGESALDYRCATSTVVCNSCARKHGGVYDGEIEKWTVAPRLPRSNIVGGEDD